MTATNKQLRNWVPRSFQQKGIKLGISQASLGMLMEPGLGKTSTMLAIFKILKSAGYVERMLIIAPIKPMYLTWPAEIDGWAEFDHLRWAILHGPDKNAMLEADADVFLVNPEGMKWLEPHLLKLKCDVLVVDESTTFKNSTSKRFKMLRRFIPTFARRYCLTGTVSPNGLMDLFGQMYILDEGSALGRYITHFRKRWFYTEPWAEYDYKPLPNAFEEITERIAPLCLQMDAKDHLDMPDIVEVPRIVQLPADVQRMYKEVEDEYIAQLPSTGQTVVAASDAAAGAKCRQIANGAVYVEGKMWEPVHNEKIAELLRLLEEIGEHSVVIVYEFQHDMERILHAVEGAECLTGASGETLRDIEGRFNAGLLRRLVVHAAGTRGLNIQHNCHHMVFFALTWDWEAYKQTIDRLHRQGQHSSMVMVYKLLAEGTLDEEINGRLDYKGGQQARVNEGIRNHGHG